MDHNVYPQGLDHVPQAPQQALNAPLPDSPVRGPVSGDLSALVDMFTTALGQITNQMQQQTAAMMQQFAHTNASRERPVEGTRMPTFHGKPSESVEQFLFEARTYMEGRNVDYRLGENQARVVAMLASALRDGAASWYHARVAIEQRPLRNIDEFEHALREEFVPPDQQQRLRSALKQCRQTGSIDEYVAQFRQLMAQIREMSELDKVDRFVDGLKPETRKEINYLRCATLSEAISAAQAYERTHFDVNLPRTPRVPRRPRDTPQGPTPMDVSSFQVSKEQCRAQNLCFYCKEPGHRIRDCKKRTSTSQQEN